MATVNLEKIVKKYSENVIAVHEFSLDIKDKEFVVLVGPSGCGKSTTLRMIAGLEDMTSGNIYIDDEIVNNVSSKDRNIAMVFQNYALYPHLTVYKNMAFCLKLKKVKKDVVKEKVESIAKLLQITELLYRKPSELSGGERQRVALGRAMIREPKVFLLDEPLSNLDAKLRFKMRTEIIKLHKKLDSIFVYVTHDQTEAMTMADRIVVMKDGYIQQVDTPINIYEHPVNMFVAGFMSSPQMNFIEVELCSSEETFLVKFEDKEVILPIDKYSSDVLSMYDNKKLMMGIRPEDIMCTEQISQNEVYILDAELDVKELLGSETYLHLNCYGEKIVAKVQGKSTFNEGQHIKISFDISKVHLFDKDTRENVCMCLINKS